MTDLLTGPLALVARYVLVLAAGWLGAQGLGVWDSEAQTLTIHVESASAVLGGLAAMAVALGWRHVVARVGGKL